MSWSPERTRESKHEEPENRRKGTGTRRRWMQARGSKRGPVLAHACANLERARRTGPYFMIICVLSQDRCRTVSTRTPAMKDGVTHPEERNHEDRDAGQEGRAAADGERVEELIAEQWEDGGEHRAEERVACKDGTCVARVAVEGGNWSPRERRRAKSQSTMRSTWRHSRAHLIET